MGHDVVQLPVQLMYVFATLLISRINSWGSWFIFNLQKINKLVTHPAHIHHVLSTYNVEATSWFYYIAFIHSWTAIFWSTLWMGPSQSRSRERLPPFPRVGAMSPPSVWLALVSAINKLFVPTVHTSHIQPPCNCYTSHVNVMGVRYHL